ncbi:hypothetical protein AGIG_G14481 [Arapaima gigas]
MKKQKKKKKKQKKRGAWLLPLDSAAFCEVRVTGAAQSSPRSRTPPLGRQPSTKRHPTQTPRRLSRGRTYSPGTAWHRVALLQTEDKSKPIGGIGTSSTANLETKVPVEVRRK